MKDGTIFECEITVRGKSKQYECKWDAEWKAWSINGDNGWKRAGTTMCNRITKLYMDKSELSLFDQLQDQIAEIRGMVSPAPAITDELASLDVNNETVLRPDYIHHDAEKVLGGPIPRHRVFARPEINGDRHYLYAIPNPDPTSAKSWLIQKPLPGVTSVLKKTMPTPPSLIKWMASFPGGYDAAKEHTMLMAARGTIMHGMFADFVNGLIPEFDSTEWHAYVELKMRKQKVYRKYHGEWQHFFKKSILSLMQWIQDYEVTIILMEVALVSDSLGYAGQVDVICEMNDRIYTKPVYEVFPAKQAKADRPKRQTKVLAAAHEARHWEVVFPGSEVKAAAGEIPSMDTRREPNTEGIFQTTVHNPRTRINAIVDFKSGEHSHDSHAVQLAMYVPLVQEHFPGFKIDQVWNWHPTDWRERPSKDGEWNFSYKFINQSKKLSTEKVNHLLALYAMDSPEQNEKVVSFAGKPELGKSPADMVKTVDFVEHWESTLFLAIDHGLEID